MGNVQIPLVCDLSTFAVFQTLAPKIMTGEISKEMGNETNKTFRSL